MDCNGIGERIAELRKKKGETQADLAKALYVKRETVNQWENETRDLKTAHTVALATHFGVTCDEILRGIPSEYVDINKKTGLSSEAIKALLSTNDKNKGWSSSMRSNYILSIMNLLLENEQKYHVFWAIFNFLSDYSPLACLDFNDLMDLPKKTEIPGMSENDAKRLVEQSKKYLIAHNRFDDSFIPLNSEVISLSYLMLIQTQLKSLRDDIKEVSENGTVKKN